MQSSATTHPQIDFLTIGHICYDLVPGGRVVGGAVAYTASTAQFLGCRAAIVTSAAAGDEWSELLPEIPIHRVDAPSTTIFENIYTPIGRNQRIHSVAGRIGFDSIPRQWARAPMVFLGPISNEIDAGIIRIFSNSLVGVGPQGWMRRWDEHGQVFAVDWKEAVDVLPLAAVTFVSTADLPNPAVLAEYARLARLLVVTDGAHGCTVYFHREQRSFMAPKVDAIDTTGAGDIFATAYMVRLFQTSGDVWDAAQFANHIASTSVTRFGLRAKMELIRSVLSESRNQPAG